MTARQKDIAREILCQLAAALAALLKKRVAVLQRELYQIEAQVRAEFGMSRYAPLSAAALKKHMLETERSLRGHIAMMQHDLRIVQDDKHFKRWLIPFPNHLCLGAKPQAVH